MRRGEFYLDKKVLAVQIKDYQDNGVMSPELLANLRLIVAGVISKFANGRDVDDALADIFIVVDRIKFRIRPEGAFNYLTTLCKHNLFQYHRKEMMQQKIIDKGIERLGGLPHYSFK